jgi:hypothetical protein
MKDYIKYIITIILVTALSQYTDIVADFYKQKIYCIVIHQDTNKYINDNMIINNDLIAAINNIVKVYLLNTFLIYIDYDRVFNNGQEDFIADFINKNLTPIN